MGATFGGGTGEYARGMEHRDSYGGAGNVYGLPSAASKRQSPLLGRKPTAHMTLVVRDSTIEYAIRVLAHQAHLRPVYNNSGPLFAKRITVHIVDASLTDAFATVLHGTGLVAKAGARMERRS